MTTTTGALDRGGEPLLDYAMPPFAVPVAQVDRAAAF